MCTPMPAKSSSARNSIVDSTKSAARYGDQAWAAILERHDRVIHTLVRAHSGRVVKATGDGRDRAGDPCWFAHGPDLCAEAGTVVSGCASGSA